MSQSTTYLIIGASRGIGRGIVEKLLQRPNVTVIAGVRDPSDENGTSLSKLSVAKESKLIVVQFDIGSESSTKEAVKSLQEKFGVSQLDTVIVSAGLSKYYGKVAETPLIEVVEHYQTNVVGAFASFQASYPLLQKSKKPIFVVLSTGVASITDMEKFPLPNAAYGASKAAVNYLMRKIHFENPWLIAFPLSPGWVQTDMGTFGALSMGMKEAPVTLQASVAGILNRIDNATREETSGTFQSFDESKYNW